ncbi:MAG: hypothetical protein KJ914_00080 [Gammaproteobacteria bacterium]|nr:hypothetical protein [Gammaproteobacteria bacterium]MBU1725212.1 hypothetical protein [Gammaproteobacteria bacterium]MBU2005663.1 hypothetical protein [Gammaproteobacteria bacterium]
MKKQITREMELLERRVIEIPADCWDAFKTLVNAPPKEIPAVKELARYAPSWNVFRKGA